MSNDQDNLQTPDEKALLVARAKTLGISHSPNIGVDKLRERIDEHLQASATAPTNGALVGNSRMERRREATRLIRVRITNLDPNKKNLPGEIFTVANDEIGTVKKYIPYEGKFSENGYHVPYVIVKALKAKKFQVIRTTKDHLGREVTTSEWAREFAIEELPPLTEKQLKELADSQRNSGI